MIRPLRRVRPEEAIQLWPKKKELRGGELEGRNVRIVSSSVHISWTHRVEHKVGRLKAATSETSTVIISSTWLEATLDAAVMFHHIWPWSHRFSTMNWACAERYDTWTKSDLQPRCRTGFLNNTHPSNPLPPQPFRGVRDKVIVSCLRRTSIAMDC
jgi:hypothetical protein